uniref:DOMON domain-containing protein n=1 Tax=Panagrolaimus sp. PS1159 TaxID=55785 RepID=A0AC35G924_9BILA
MNPKTPIGYHDLNNPKVSKTKVCICDDSGVPVKAVPSRVRARRQVRNPFEDREEPEFAGLPDMAKIGQISIAELTGQAKYNVKMDPFACSDVTVLKVLSGGKSRVVDAFAQSKYGLEPDEFFGVVDAFAQSKYGLEPDEFFGGEQSFTDVSASEENGEAIVLFKRSLKGSDVADHSIMPGNTQFFWANGPEGNLPVRISGAAHIETGYVNFFNTTEPVIADLDELELPTTVYIPPPPTSAPKTTTTERRTTTTEEEKEEILAIQTVKQVEATRRTTQPSTEATTEETTTELPFIPVEVTEEATDAPTTTTTTTTSKPLRRPPTTESNLIDEPDSGEREVVEPIVLSGETSQSHPAAEIAPCHGSFVYPPKCNENCVYAVNWQTDGGNAHFNLWAKLKPKMWSGIGFSKEGAMMNADAIIVSVLEDSSVTVMDQFSPGYGRPTIDESQDIFGVSTRYMNGQVMANFSRSLTTTDAGNDIDLSECQFFLFLQSGGHLEGGSNELRKHFETPISSSSRICLGKCGAKEEIPSTTLNPFEDNTVTKKQHKSDQNTVQLAGSPSLVIPALKPPTHFVYDAVLKFKDIPFKSDFNDIESPEAEKMAVSIRNQLGPVLKEKWPQLQRIGIIKFAGPPVKALTRMEFDGRDSPTVKEVETYLKQIAVAGKVGNLQIDSNDIMLAEQKPKVESEEQRQYQTLITWIVIVIAILILLTLILCCCCWSVCRKSKRKTYPAKQMSFAPPVVHQSFAGPYISEPIYDAKHQQQQDRTLSKRQMTSGGSSSPESSPQPKNHPEETPKGMGETTYQEWYTKVASKDVPTHHQESTLSAAVSRPHSRMSGVSGTPYISYPHESGYYTLGGENRLPPPYYRQY